MNRKQSRAIGGEVYRQWLEGYKYRKETTNPNSFDRYTHKGFLATEVSVAQQMSTETAKAFVYGLAAHTRNLLKKGKYAR